MHLILKTIGHLPVIALSLSILISGIYYTSIPLYITILIIFLINREKMMNGKIFYYVIQFQCLL